MASMQDRVAELRRIALKYGGRPSPENVLEESAPPEAVLHSEFVWDNQIAGHQYRLQQARRLLRLVVWDEPDDDVVAPEVPRRKVPMPEYVSVPGERGHGYRTVDEVRADEELSLRVDIGLLREFEGRMTRAQSPRLTLLLMQTRLLLAGLEEELNTLLHQKARETEEV